MEKKNHGILSIILLRCVLVFSLILNIIMLKIVLRDKRGPENGQRIARGMEPQNRMPGNVRPDKDFSLDDIIPNINVFWDGQTLYFRPDDSLGQEKFLAAVEELSASGFYNIQNLSPGVGPQNRLVEVELGSGNRHLRFLCLKK
jgi:hypothetical protein